jgi:hypothetical protein
MTKPKNSKNLEAFRAQFDPNVLIPAKFRAGFASLLKEKGDGAWEPEGEFTKRAKLGQAELGKFRPQFEAHVVTTKGKSAKRIWFAEPASAEAMRAIIG